MIVAAMASRSGKSEAEILENLPALAKAIRSKGHQWLKQNSDWRQSWALDTDANHVTEAGSLPTTPDQYLQAIGRPNRWLDGLVAQALATALQTDFLVFEKRQGKWKMSARIQADGSKLHDPIILLLGDNHYRTIRDHASIPKEWKHSTPKGPFQRAAGKSTTSFKSFCSWLKTAAIFATNRPRSSIDESKSLKQLDASWFKSARSIPSHASAKNRPSTCASKPQPPNSSAGPAGRKVKVQDKHQWTRPLCDLKIEASGSRHLLKYKKNNHLRYRHKGEDLSKAPSLRPVPAPACVVSSTCPKQPLRGSARPWCPAQLPSLDGNALECSSETPYKNQT